MYNNTVSSGGELMRLIFIFERIDAQIVHSYEYFHKFSIYFEKKVKQVTYYKFIVFVIYIYELFISLYI